MAVLCCAVFMLTGCTVVELQGETTPAEPNLGMLFMAPYQEAEEIAESRAEERSSSRYQVDLWLDGSQLMGGVNPHASNIYPHFSPQYREGGFHYRFNDTVGWYQRVLTSMLEAAAENWVRVLRFGNERLPDSLFKEEGLAPQDASPATLRSLRRDLFTYAIRPLRSVFDGMSAENMKNSFYCLGSIQMNQMSRFEADGGIELENPNMVAQMDALLNRVIQRLTDKEGPDPDLLAHQSREGDDYPLLYALENIDLSRLSVIVFDPAGIRNLSRMATAGSWSTYVEELLVNLGVFDRGLAVGLYAFQMDYMGQMASVSAADLSEPFIWGKPLYNKTRPFNLYAAPMPRIAMALVIGPEERVQDYMGKLDGMLEKIGKNSPEGAEEEKRGPLNGELTYGRSGVLAIQELFAFEYWNTLIVRPSGEHYSQHTSNVTLTVAEGDGWVEERNGLQTVILSPQENGGYMDRTLRLSFPRQGDGQWIETDYSTLENACVEVTSTILLAEILPNIPSTAREPAKGEQIITFRDRLYIYTHRDNPFGSDSKGSPFTLKTMEPSGDGQEMACTLEVEGSILEAGYYRLEVQADLPGNGVEWVSVDWIDGDISQAAPIPDPNEVAHWEAFSAEMARYEKDRRYVIPEFEHAWGTKVPKRYSVSVPDCPPVEKAIGLVELTNQIRNAATQDERVFMRYVFDIFVDNRVAISSAPGR